MSIWGAPSFALLLAAAALAQGTGVIRGSVVATGSTLPVAGARVILVEDMGMPAGSARRYETRTGRDGHFEFVNAPITRYRWTVTASGYRTGDGALRVTAATTALPIELDKMATLSGQLASDDGRPLAGANVAALPPWGYETTPPESTDGNGRFSITVPPGRYYVVAHPKVRPTKASKGWLSAFYPGSSTRMGAQVVEVRSGEEKVGLDLRVHEDPAVVVSGQVLNMANRPVPNATVALAPSDRGLHFSMGTVADEEGRYSFTGIPTGFWAITAESTENNVKSTGFVTVVVTDRDVDRFNVRLRPPFRVSGTVGYATPTGNTGVYLVREVDGVRMQKGVMTQETGRFTIPDVYPGRYRIVPAGKPPGQFVSSVRLGAAEVMGREVLLTGPEAPITIEYTNNGGIVKGMIRDSRSGYVALVPAEESLRHAVFIETMLTDNEGRFEFLGVRPGDYYAFAFTRLETQAFEDPDSFRQLLGAATNVRVAEGESQILEPVLTKWPW